LGTNVDDRDLGAGTRRRRLAAIGVAASLVLTVAACGSASPTNIIIVNPTSSPTPTATAEAATPSPSATPSPTQASETPGKTGTPAPPPTTPPTSACSGSATNKTWWAIEAKKLPFDVYCGVVPSGWWFSVANDTYDKGGTMTAVYKGPSSGEFTIKEGAFCTIGSSACSPHDTYLGSAKFGDLLGGLYSLGPGLGYAIYINAGTTHGYTALGTNMSETTFINLAKALIKVPKS
jgi:hypothetical protein